MGTREEGGGERASFPSIADASPPSPRFRFNPRYQLVQLERMPPEEGRLYAELRNAADYFGIVRLVHGGGAVDAVDRDTALLLLALLEPGPLPSFARGSAGEAAAPEVLRLVMDGILEVDLGQGFLIGAPAWSGLHVGAPLRGQGVLWELSRRAVEHAAALPDEDPHALARHLYGYHRLPLSPRWRRLLATPGDVQRFLGLEAGSRVRNQLQRYWSFQEQRGQDGRVHWLTWRRRQRLGPAVGPLRFKLYLSPLPAAMPEALAILGRELHGSSALQFKVGASASGLLRPDKCVLYFDSFEALGRAAQALSAPLVAIPAHGVPFTAEAAGDGLLSWGVDPRREERPTRWSRVQSWRLWLADRLARALQVARREPEAAVPAWRFALERLRLEGIDVSRWAPSHSEWSLARKD